MRGNGVSSVLSTSYEKMVKKKNRKNVFCCFRKCKVFAVEEVRTFWLLARSVNIFKFLLLKIKRVFNVDKLEAVQELRSQKGRNKF